MRGRFLWIGSALMFLFAAGSATLAEDGVRHEPVAAVSAGGSGLSFQPHGSDQRLSLTVNGPDVWFRQVFDDGQPPTLSVFRNDQPLPDGRYTYELRVIAIINDDAARQAFDANDTAAIRRIQAQVRAQQRVQSGSFRVVSGGIVLDQ